jgi:hypothetical protein
MSVKHTLSALLVSVICLTCGPTEAQTLNYETSWVGNTYGFGDGRWMQLDIEGMYVQPDGLVLTNTPWDESGAEVASYKNGLPVALGKTTHGWGNGGGDAITSNSKYVFSAAQIANESGGLKGHDYPKKGSSWYGVTRRQAGDFSQAAGFEGGFGNGVNQLDHAFLLVDEVSDKDDGSVRGLAASATELYVSDRIKNRIEVFDAESMKLLRWWPAVQPAQLALDADGSLWAIVGQAPKLAHFSPTGHALNDIPRVGNGVVPTALSIDPAHRLLVTDNGVAQQVLIYTRKGSSWQLETFGARGGIYSGGPAMQGKAGPARFNGLVGVGADRAGNLYVASNGNGPRPPGNPGFRTGTELDLYSPAGKRLALLASYLFVDTVSLDPSDPTSAYSGVQHFHLDYSKPSGQEWSYVGFTANRFKYPDELLWKSGLEYRGLPNMVRINGKLFMFTTDMFSINLGIFRFDPAHEGETAIPSGLFAQRVDPGNWPNGKPLQGEWIWRDANGDGKFSADEYHLPWIPQNAPEMNAWWVDDRGNVWEGSFEQGIRRFRVQGLDHVGNPVYDFEHVDRMATPPLFSRLQRLRYVPESDTMYLFGSSPEFPYNPAQWNSLGHLMARYDHWMSGKPVLRWRRGLVADDSSTAVAGSYVFAVEAVTGIVEVYDNCTGQLVGQMSPGPEVGRTSGWVDVPNGMTATRRANGEYVVLVEEDARAKAIMYRWTPPSGSTGICR